MNSIEPRIIHRNDYREPEFTVPSIELTFNLHDTQTIVTSLMKIKRNGEHGEPLKLNGEKLKLLSVEIDGKELSAADYSLTESLLTIDNVSDSFSLKVATEINPLENQALEGLYKSGDIFCTQNEPEGFRRITYFPDRPDVMSVFTTKIIADREKYPVLLSNGNCTDTLDLGDGRHWAVWYDPFPKPPYLFALVAGDLGMVKGTYRTGSGRDIDCRVYCDRGNEDRCRHALASLMKAMEWDEKRFGLEYDLDIYMIVAVDSFNMGAMENKGLNIFNSRYVLASAETATDDDYIAIEGVVGHEYFHNWTGNRVTLRDWFQLTLKEGLTVFRDQEFTSDMQSRAVKRIEDANDLRSMQFVEDAGPNAHPVRPDTYMEINNFYTVTVYEKGAAVIRMIHTILGEDGFQNGMRKYFELYDGRAVTCDDFVYAMESASGSDLSQFRLWYTQSGTPELEVSSKYDDKEEKYCITVKQSLPGTIKDSGRKAMHIPLAVGLLNPQGCDIPLNDSGDVTVLLHVKEEQHEFVFNNIKEKPVVSLNRNFSAPVVVNYPYSPDELSFLFAHDSDDFNRWDAGQAVAKGLLKRYIESIRKDNGPFTDDSALEVYRHVINDPRMDHNLKSLALTLPSEDIIAQDYDPIDFDAVHEARILLKKDLSVKFEDELVGLYSSLEDKRPYSPDIASAGRRKLRLRALSYLAATGKEKYQSLCHDLYFSASNMTEKMGAFSILADFEGSISEKVTDDFYKRWKHDQRVITKWFSVQALSTLPGRLERVMELEKLDTFDVRIPNLVRALITAFSRNMAQFHDVSGKGYRYITDRIIEIDSFNPQISSNLSKSFKLYSRTDPGRKKLMKAELERILATEKLSKNTHEIVANTLNFVKK